MPLRDVARRYLAFARPNVTATQHRLAVTTHYQTSQDQTLPRRHKTLRRFAIAQPNITNHETLCHLAPPSQDRAPPRRTLPYLSWTLLCHRVAMQHMAEHHPYRYSTVKRPLPLHIFKRPLSRRISLNDGVGYCTRRISEELCSLADGLELSPRLNMPNCPSMAIAVVPASVTVL